MSDLEPSLPERAVARLAATLDRSRPGRRSFLASAAVVGSALPLKPWGYLVQDAAADDVVCGADNECADGWTAFCCTVNGTNSCPPGSFAAGWWKADASGFCCGSARYYIDCNASCGSGWQCHCASGTCDRRRVACNQFRYGQCHQEIACYGPVVCRVVTCQPPWQWDGSCTTASATDNRTATHSAPCLGSDCESPVDRLWNSLGGAAGVLGKKISGEFAVRPAGYETRFEHGAIFRRDSTVYEVHGAIWDRYVALGAQTGWLGLPIANTRTAHDGIGRYSDFTGGTIYYTAATGAHEMHGALRDKFRKIGVSRLGYPTTDTRLASSQNGKYNELTHGVIYYRAKWGAWEVHGDLFAKWNALGRERSFLGFPRSDTLNASSQGGRYNEFDYGAIYYRPGHGTWEIHGDIYAKWKALRRERSDVGFPISDTQTGVDGKARYNLFDHGAIYYRPTIGTFEVHRAIFDKWQALGRDAGPLGLPTTDIKLAATTPGKYNGFDNGIISYHPTQGTFAVYGPIWLKWKQMARDNGPLGYPLSDVTATSGGGSTCRFEHGRLTYDPVTATVTVELA
jgi:uncharacterized protein with LGFP repeats